MKKGRLIARAVAMTVALTTAGLYWPAFAAAQAPGKGLITGTVIDADDKMPIPNARVGLYQIAPGDSVWSTVTGAATGADGGYRFEAAPGLYRLIVSLQSYAPTVRDDIKLSVGESVDVRISLVPKPIMMEGVDVRGAEVRGTEASALSKQKKAAAVSDAITSEQIAKSTDSNAAEALQRVTGLSVVGGRYVFVRGLGERYSSTQVNGSSVGTPEPNKRVVPLDVFPTGVLDNVVVQKSYTPDQDAEFGGGVVNLNTKDFIEGRSFTQNVSVGYSANATRRSFLTYPGGNLDFLGFDDGTRDLPDLIQSLAGDQRVVPGTLGQPGFTAEEIQAMGRSFANVWSPRGERVAPNYSVAGSYASGFKMFGKEVGFLTSLTLNNSFSTMERQNNAYVGSATDLTPLYRYNITESIAKVLGGGLGNLSLRADDHTTFRVRALYTRSSENAARISNGPNYDYGSDGVQIAHLGFVERGLLSGALSGEHRVPRLGNLLVDWSAGYSEARRGEPDRRENVYELNSTDGSYLMSTRTTYPFTRIFGEMEEFDRSLRANVTFPVPSWRSGEAKIRAGYALRDRSRVSAFRRFGFRLGLQGQRELDTGLPPELLLIPENIKNGYFTLNELTRDNDQYRAKQDLHAGYAMVDVPVLSKLRLVGGARVETSDQRVESQSPIVTGAPRSEVRLKDTDVMPSVNATYAVTERMNVRAGFSNTVSRPELRELSPFDMYDYEAGYTEQGSLGLKSARIQSYDVRWELYPDARELLALSVFHKRLDQPIESIVLPTSGGYTLSPRNGKDGRLTGGEAEIRLGLDRVWNGLAIRFPLIPAPNVLEQLAVMANYSRVSSNVAVQITTDGAGKPVYREGPLGGQSTYALNTGLFYASKAIDGSILYTAFGRRLAQVGAGQYPNSLPDIYEYPANSLDLTMGKSISGDLRLKLSAENLLNDVIEFRQSNQVTRRYLPGRSISLSVSFN